MLPWAFADGGNCRRTTLYRVELETGHRIVAHVAPAARLRFLRVIPGDRVRVEVSPLDPGRGRIVRKAE
ncbi:MAG: TOBE domain-containing protein [Chloroflexi bacterium]|nr:MAG: TOBE domain-containing protein [Chloroflexota bacterium]